MSQLDNAVRTAVQRSLEARAITQRQAAVALSMSQQAFNDRMRGRTPFTLADLEALAVLGIDVAELIYPTTVSAGDPPARSPRVTRAEVLRTDRELTASQAQAWQDMHERAAANVDRASRPDPLAAWLDDDGGAGDRS